MPKPEQDSYFVGLIKMLALAWLALAVGLFLVGAFFWLLTNYPAYTLVLGIFLIISGCVWKGYHEDRPDTTTLFNFKSRKKD